MRLHRVQQSFPPPEASGSNNESGTALVMQWLNGWLRSFPQIYRFSFFSVPFSSSFSSSSSSSPGFLHHASRHFETAASSWVASDYRFFEVWITAILLVLLACVLRQLLRAYRTERRWQSLHAHVRATIALRSFDPFYLKDSILDFFSSAACADSPVSLRYTAELFATLEQRADIFPPQALRALASELAALGALVDLAALQTAIKRQRDRRRRPCSGADSKSQRRCRECLFCSQRLQNVFGFVRLLMYSLYDAMDVVFNDPACSLVALCT